MRGRKTEKKEEGGGVVAGVWGAMGGGENSEKWKKNRRYFGINVYFSLRILVSHQYIYIFSLIRKD